MIATVAPVKTYLEAYINSDGEHQPYGNYWCALYRNELIKGNLKTISDCNDVAKQFVNDICTYIRDWSLASDIRDAKLRIVD